MRLRCPRGHALRSFCTESLDDGSLITYVLIDGQLYLAEAPAGPSAVDGAPEVWRIHGDDIVREHRFTLREVGGPLTLQLYGCCEACDAALVCFRLTIRPGEPTRVERLSASQCVPSAS
ncbi:MAG TPA: hypothetical protein VMG12_19195 [Polyangiaceae bacterium]|nr:hypothetical protein [Polyangiaceae bacterium]